MTQVFQRPKGGAGSELRDEPARQVLLLAVGDFGEDDHHPLPGDPEIVFVDFVDVSEALLALLAPDVVMSPALSRGFDCIDLAVRLTEFGYGGRYRVLSNRLPDPGIVRREIQTLCPDLDFEIVDFRSTTLPLSRR